MKRAGGKYFFFLHLSVSATRLFLLLSRRRQSCCWLVNPLPASNLGRLLLLILIARRCNCAMT